MFTLTLKRLSLWLSLGCLGMPLWAEECGVLRLQALRSTGTTITNNQCIDSELSINAVVSLTAGSRVWLESVKAQHSEGFQLICQNHSTVTAKLKIDSSLLPWIVPLPPLECGAWVNKRLRCQQGTETNQILQCALAAKTSPLETTLQAKTSVAMRSINKQNPTSIRLAPEELGTIRGDVALCRTLTNTHTPITLAWHINTQGRAEQITQTSQTNNSFSACAIEALATHQFSTLFSQLSFKADF